MCQNYQKREGFEQNRPKSYPHQPLNRRHFNGSFFH